MSAPKLRFKEFDGDWTLDKVGKFLIEYKQKVPSSTDIEIYSSSRNGLKPQKEYFDNRELQNFGEYGVVPPNYLTYRHMSDDTTFKFNINLIGKKIVVSKEYPVFTTNEFMDSSFLLFKLNESNDFKKFAIEQKKGGTRTRLYFKALCTWETLLPTKEEQTKIATFLSAVDEKIAQLSQKLHLLGQYKQGMMQKLFSQQIRFKADDGREFGEWDQLKFKDVIKIKYGKDHKKLDDGDIPVLGTGGVMRYVDSYLYEGESILIGRKGTIDKPRFISGKFWTVDTLFYTEIGEKILPKFAFQQLLLVNWLNLNEATGVPSLNTTSIGNIELKVPCLAEQTKIANVLSAIDQKIEVVSKQIEQAKQWKKGLLQQMFI